MEGAFQKGQPRETGNIDEDKQNKITMQHVPNPTTHHI